jgi:adenine-specific DNA-methyltransferase
VASQNLLNELIDLLSGDDRLVSDAKLLKNKVIELALGLDGGLLRRLLGHQAIRQHFFVEVDGVLVFDKVRFQQFVSNKQFLPDSYTAYKNKIGLMVGDEYLTDNKDVVLAWPYKDCVLEGGQDKEDAKRNEIFWNETLAPDQIDRLLSPKVLTNFKRYDKDGEHEVKKISPDDNLIIKGNNLLALHTLKKAYAGKVKLIYIDPPYNTENDSFQYNDSFSHSTWLSFIKGRLEIAKELLIPQGVITISIDQNEAFYLKVLGDEIFGRDHFIAAVTTQNNPKGRVMDKHFATSHEYLLFYSKAKLSTELSIKKTSADLKKDYTEKDEDGYFRTLELRNTHREFGKHNRANLCFPLYVNPIDQTVSIENNKDYTIEVEPVWDDGFEGCWTWGATKCQLEADLLIGRQIKGKWKIYRKSYAQSEEGEIVSKKLKTIWFAKEFQTEKGQKTIDETLGKGKFRSPKPVELIKTIVDLATAQDTNDIVLDFFAGSGTTAHAVLELNKQDGGSRKFIVCEQMHYVESVTRPRIHQVIKNNGENSVVYSELAKANQDFLDQIEDAKTTQALSAIWEQMQEKAFLSYRINPKSIDVKSADFQSLSLDDQKRFLIETLDKNMLYVPLSEIDDKSWNISEQDKKLNKQLLGE